MNTRLLLLPLATSVLAQEPLTRRGTNESLTLRQAAELALQQNPALEAASAQTRAAQKRTTVARSGYLPTVHFVESFARSNNPVFVFSSLLTQRQFEAGNFALDRLNRPDFLNNFQSQVGAEQTVYDWGATRSAVRTAELASEGAGLSEQQSRMATLARVAAAYSAGAMARASLQAALEGLRSAQADRERAQGLRDAGLTTNADLLSAQVQEAAMQELTIRRRYEIRVADAALNELMGLPLDWPVHLPEGLTVAQVPEEAPNGTVAARPDVRRSELALDAAREQANAARAALLPRISVRGAFEANRQQVFSNGGVNWFASATLRWSLFDGGASRARVSEAEHEAVAAEAGLRQQRRHAEWEVLEAWAAVRAASERIRVAEAAIAQAKESLRIIKDRYEAGLATMSDLLRNESALLETRTRRLAAIHEQRVAAARLELSMGTISLDSEAMR